MMTSVPAMAIRTAATLLLGVWAGWLTMRYNMHMFQLNVYMNGEQKAWIGKNLRLQWILWFAMVLGIVRIFVPSVMLDVLCWLTLAVIILVYRVMREMHQKKKLVFTARVRRMVVTICVISLLLMAAAYFIGGISVSGRSGAAAGTQGYRSAFLIGGLSALSGMITFLAGAQLFMNMIANVINKPIEKGVNNHYINDAKRILAGMPDLTIIGVTGSYGKTSVKFFLQTLLQQHFSVLVTPESYNTPMGIVKTIRGQMKATHQIFVCEMGARYVGEIKEICDIVHPHHGVITSIGPQHLDTFGGIENVKSTKFELADAVPDGGKLFLNGDNEYINDYIRETGAKYDNKEKIYYFSEGSGEGYTASDISVSNLGTGFTVNAPDGESERYQMKLIGAHNVINVMGAIAVAHSFGISLHELRIPVRRLRPVKHRMEMKDNGSVTIIDDAFNSNPIGSKAAVETLALFDGMRILITPGMVELGEDEDEYNRKFGTYAADCCDRILLVGRRHTEPIKEGALSKGFDPKNLVVFDKVEDAIAYAYQIRTGEHKYILLENDLPDNY